MTGPNTSTRPNAAGKRPELNEALAGLNAKGDGEGGAKICISLLPEDNKAAVEQLLQAVQWGDMAELRLDAMKQFDLKELLAEKPCPLVVTNRPKRQGGNAPDDDEENRVRALLQAVELGAEHVDFELDAAGRIPADRGKTRIIVSHHDFQNVPHDLETLQKKMVDTGADIIKIAAMAHGLDDCLRLMERMQKADRPTILIAMGAPGVLSRVVAGRFSQAYLTYAALDAEHVAGPGQLTAWDMRNIYRVELIDAKTRLYGLLAPDANDSPLVDPMNKILRAGGRNAAFVPLCCSGGVLDLLRPLEKIGFVGLLVDRSLSAELNGKLRQLAQPVKFAKRADVLFCNEGTWQADYVGQPGEPQIRAALTAWGYTR
jgi:3-dehydroquinate dehydratase type I